MPCDPLLQYLGLDAGLHLFDFRSSLWPATDGIESVLVWLVWG